jgi:O-antigen ligase
VVGILIGGASLRLLLTYAIPFSVPVVLCLLVLLIPIVPPTGALVGTAAGVKLLARAALPFLAFCVVRYAPATMSNQRLMTAVWRLIPITLGLSMAVTLAAAFFGQQIVVPVSGEAPRFTGSLGAAGFAFFLLPYLAIAVTFVVLKGGARRLGGLAIVAGGILATLTRGALIAATVMMAAITMIVRPSRLAVVAGIAALLVFAFALVEPTVVVRLGTPPHATTAYSNITGRENLWQYVWHHFVAPSPITGSGLGSTAILFGANKPFATGAGAVHNDFLWIWAELGVIGLTVYLAGLFAVARAALRTWTMPGDIPREARMVAVAAAASMLAFSLASLSDNVIANFAHFGIPVFGLAGLAARSGDHARR